MLIDYINIKIIDTFENDRTMQVEQTQIGAPKLVYSGADDKYKSIMASEFSFNLTVIDKSDGKFFHLYTGNEKRYYVLVQDQDENMLFEGYLLPDFYEENYTNSVIFTNLTATDGIGLLKGNYLDYSYYQKETSVIELIGACLKFTKLDKQIYFTPSVLSAATNYKWNEIAIDGRTFKDNIEDEINYEGLFGLNIVYPSRKNVYEILEILINDIGCTLYAQGNKWYLEGINRKHEESQITEVYDLKGFYVSEVTALKNKVDLVFFSDPNISIQSPWKRVILSWDIDEDGDLVPVDVIAPKFDGSLAGNYTFDFWKRNGAIGYGASSKDLRFVYEIQSVFPGADLGTILPPSTLNIFRSYTPAGSYGYSYGEDLTNLPNNFVSIKNKKYLKKSDDFLERYFEIEIHFNGGDKYTVSIPNLEAGYYRKCFKIKMLSNSTVFFDTFDTSSTNVFEGKWQDKSSTYSSDMVAGDKYIQTAPMVKASLKKDNIYLYNNGFFDLHLHAPISPDYTDPYFKGYVIESLSIKYTAQKEVEYISERKIDFTTVYDLNVTYCDSVQDLSLNQYRFRRKIFDPALEGSVINIIDYQIIGGLWYYNISYQDYTKISNNTQLFTVEFGGDDILMNDLSFQFLPPAYTVFPSTISGVFWLLIYPGNITHASGIGSEITDFLNLKMLPSEPVLIGFETEDNEWREQWKRYGETENIRLVKALPKMYHDVQSGPLVCIEGTLAQTLFPREIGVFLWRDIKNFIPTRIEIDFSNGRSNVFMMESTYEIVSDYVDQ